MDLREFDLETAKELAALRTEIATLKSMLSNLPCVEHERALSRLTTERDIYAAHSKKILHLVSGIIAAIVSGIVSFIMYIVGGK